MSMQGLIQIAGGEKGLQNQVKPLLQGQNVGFDVTDLNDIVNSPVPLLVTS